MNKTKQHVSFSELKQWNDCAFKHKLMYLDDLKLFKGNEFTAFGKAIHDTCEKSLHEPEKEAEFRLFFKINFLSELKALKEDGIELDKNLVEAMKAQGTELSVLPLPALKEHFGEYEVISTEEMLYEDIEGHDYKFKGYIDAVIKTSDGKYHIIDWKTCSWGWDMRKKTDKMITYQLTYYKHFFAKKHGIDLKNIETHFALLKRTAKKNKVEIFRVTSGPKKIKNSLDLLNMALYNINNKKYIKNKLSCRNCEYYKTSHCP
tara:strand:+ start:13735 stop:14517 length:783 start_codon:yes stop_codon:yes gene_type:complete